MSWHGSIPTIQIRQNDQIFSASSLANNLVLQTLSRIRNKSDHYSGAGFCAATWCSSGTEKPWAKTLIYAMYLLFEPLFLFSS
jgi:hypothetical protein